MVPGALVPFRLFGEPPAMAGGIPPKLSLALVNGSMEGVIETRTKTLDGSIASRGMVTSLIGTVDCHASVGNGVGIGQEAMMMLFLVVVKSIGYVCSEIEHSEIRARAKFMD